MGLLDTRLQKPVRIKIFHIQNFQKKNPTTLQPYVLSTLKYLPHNILYKSSYLAELSRFMGVCLSLLIFNHAAGRY